MWNQIKEKFNLILSSLVAILGFMFLLERNKRKSLEVNEETNKVLNEIDKLGNNKNTNKDLIEREAEYRKQLEEFLKRELKREPTEQEVIDFFNKRYDNK